MEEDTSEPPPSASPSPPPVTVSVKALTNYFQSLQQDKSKPSQQVNETHSHSCSCKHPYPHSTASCRLKDGKGQGLPPVSTESISPLTTSSTVTTKCPRPESPQCELESVSQLQLQMPPPSPSPSPSSPSPSSSSPSSQANSVSHSQPPVPMPRISLIRKQTAYGTSCNHSDQSIYCDVSETSQDDYEITPMEDEEDIYEEIPDTYYSSQPDIQRASTHHQHSSPKSDQINRKFSQSLQKIKIVLQRTQRSLGEEGRRKNSLFTFKSRDSKDRKLPKPPSIEQLERPFHSSTSAIYRERRREEEKREARGGDAASSASQEASQGEENEYYYDVQELNSPGSSDDYYYCLDEPEEDDEEDPYEEITYPDEKAVTIINNNSGRGKSNNNNNNNSEDNSEGNSNSSAGVQYAEIDPVQTLELEKKIEKEQKALERRQRVRAEKWRRKFNLTGQEVPVNYGLVKADVGRGRNNRLRVKKGETVLVLRMQGNPPGLYLAKNERSEVGYVELCNIEFDPESIKAIMRVETEAASHEENGGVENISLV